MVERNEKLTGDALNSLLSAELLTMRKFAYSLTGSMEDANDIVQTAVERCLKSGVPLDGSRAWLFRVCKNLWIDELRRRNRRPTSEFDEEAVTDAPPFSRLNNAEQDLSRQQELDAMAVAFEKLPDDQRIALSMAAIDGMSYDEIASALDIPRGTVMSRIARARMALNRRLRRDKDDE